MSTVQVVDTHISSVRRSYLSAISWGAILAGVVVGLSMNLVLNLLGVAAGLMSIDVLNGGSPNENAPMIAALWNGSAMLISSFVGGYVAARMSGLKRRSDGVLHGFVSWGATTILLTGIVAAVAGILSNQLFSGITRIASAGTVATTMNADTNISRQLQALLSGTGVNLPQNINPSTLRQLQSDISSGQRNAAVALLNTDLGIELNTSGKVVDQLLILSGSPENASTAARINADNSIKAASGVTWGIVGAIILSLLLGILGGMLGAAGSRRGYHPSSEHRTVINNPNI